MSVYQEIRSELRQGGHGPLYRQIADRLAQRITRGELIAGQTLPPQRRLCKLLGVGEVTARRAMGQLVEQGLVHTHQGSGTVVAGRVPLRLRPRKHRPAGSSRFQVGLVSVSTTDGYPFIQSFVDAIERASHEHSEAIGQIGLHILHVHPNETDPQALHERLSLDELNGIMFMSPINVTLLWRCQTRHVPYVLLFNDLADGVSSSIVVDYGPGIFEAVQHLQSRGRRRIALVTSLPNRFSTGQMIDAFRLALRENSLHEDANFIVPAGYHQRQGYQATMTLLDQANPPDAILFASDFQAYGGLAAAEAHRLNIPDDLSIIGAGQIDKNQGRHQELSTINLNTDAMARLALQVLQGLQARNQLESYRHVVTSRLIQGQTS